MISSIDETLPIEDLDRIETSTCAIDSEAVSVARSTIESLGDRGVEALGEFVEMYSEALGVDRMLLDRDDLRASVDRIDPGLRSTIERAGDRIRQFAELQKKCLAPCRAELADLGMEFGHDLIPIECAGCYAPGGRFPLPSSVLMSVIPAVVAGVSTIRLASPRPTDATLAAAWFSGADSLLAAGGAHAVGAFALGLLGPRCDIVVGPGNSFVTAAKSVVSGPDAPGGCPISIDGLAGPSELMVLADETADPTVVAIDLVAQAEHDPAARVWLATTSEETRFLVRRAILEVCVGLPAENLENVKASISRGAAIVVPDEDGLVAAADRLGPEHLEIMTDEPERIGDRVRHAGAVFLGRGGAEVFGDYGVGPNHILPTGGSARRRGGLSVFDFLRTRTWIRSVGSEVPNDLVVDTARFARSEGLEAHARSAEARSGAIVCP